MQSIARTLLLILGSGCTVGAPSGFSNGDHWTFPLVGPLEDGLLITPGRVHGHGPYLFAIDPDANVTALDAEVVRAAGLRSGIGPKRVDESDTGQNRFYAEMLDLEIADLKVERRDAMVFTTGFYDTEGRRISGIIGRDVLADSLVFGFDRDQGIATLSTVKAFKPPPDATAISYENVFGRSNNVSGKDPPPVVTSRGGGGLAGRAVAGPEQAAVPARLQDKERVGVNLPDITPMPRRLVTARIGDASFAMHLDLGATVSQLRQDSWSKAGVTPADFKLRVVDEAMTARDITAEGRAAHVAVGGTSSHATFAPYIERRFLPAPIDGSLGLDFFEPYAVYANWDTSTYLLKPRGDAAATTTARLGRWGSYLPACAHPGCVTAQLAPFGDGVALAVVRDPEAANKDLELLLTVTAPGKSARRLVVELPRAIDKVSGVLSADYRDAAIAVLDASPFPRDCGNQGGCIVPLGADVIAGFEPPLRDPSQGPAEPVVRSPPMVKLVKLDKLHRLTGEPQIAPSATAAGQPVAAAIVKLCLGADGKVESTKLVKSSNVAAYDEELQATIKTTWTFEPFETDGQPAPVCTQVTFGAH